MRFWLRYCALLLTCSIARAGDLPSAGSATSAVTGDSHGWFATPARIGAAIQHLPPRAVDQLGRSGSSDGTVRLAASLAQSPEALAAVENRLFLVFPTSAGSAGATRRQVLMLEAQRGSIDGAWVGEPGGDRLPSQAALPGDGGLRGFVGTPAGPVALIDRPMRLLLLSGEAWIDVPIPPASAGADLRLVGTSSGLAMVELGADPAKLWTIAMEVRMSRAPPVSAWKSTTLSFRDRSTDSFALPSGAIQHVRGQYVYDTRDGEDVRLWSVTGQGATELARLPDISRGYAVVPLDQAGRVAVVWRMSTAAQESATPAMERTRIAEVSVFTGQVLFNGDAESRPLFSSFDLKVLAAFLVTVMLAIVVFVLRPERTDAPLSLPKGVILAEPGRRIAAGFIDAALALILASSLTRIGVAEALSFKALTGRADVLTLYLASVATGLVLSTLLEWLFGRTVGKALTGAETVRSVVKRLEDGQVQADVSRVTLGRALVRNIVKWVLPPVALTGLSTPERRHRGDTASGTVVIVREEPEGQ